MVDVGVHVEQADARALDGIAEGTDHALVAPLTDVRNAFEQRVSGPGALGR